MISDEDAVIRDYHAIIKQIELGDPMQPQEVQEVINALRAEGYHFEAQRLARMDVNWDR